MNITANTFTRGVNTVSQGGSVEETNVYRNTFIERNEVWSLATAGRNKDTVTGLSRLKPAVRIIENGPDF